MTKLTKNGLSMLALDSVQVSAFLNSGWTIVSDNETKVVEKAIETETVEKTETETNVASTPKKAGRKANTSTTK